MVSNQQIIVRIPFKENQFAKIAKNSLDADREPNSDKINRILQVENEILVATFTCESTKMLRTAVNAFFDMALVLSETFEAFG
ncbi:hypothetical protein BB559_005067 [Furculomyces boomerangus]|uniref:Transcription factor Pcc1 n=2 Tax=Harpellales TaxID=61421 RepID=A0A2T9YB61_9FUNG|nr:hypothetical protein BB559_005067 [Furculomyces boomerangus]PWA00082.1 hypothetical protein BB558_003907 [Smittium angustum]PWA02529.1 hypothetical protein BB558_001350 [Smittium angustum]